MVKERNALLSVFDKTGIEEFARELVELGFKLFASGGTASRLKGSGLEVTDVADLVGGKPILDHRVVTLSREVHGGLLADPQNDQHRKELEAEGIPIIDLVCVNFYPLEAAIADPKATEASVLDSTDIGGPAMIRAAAKGRRIVISDPSQYDEVIAWLRGGELEAADFRRKLAAAAERKATEYSLASARYLSAGEVDGFVVSRVTDLKYGENAWQAPAALYSTNSDDPLALERFELVGGESPSYNNVVDVDRMLQTMAHIATSAHPGMPRIAIGVKHGNACGVGVDGKSRVAAIRKMVEGDTRAIFGGLVMVNFEVDEDAAEALLHHRETAPRRLLDAVVAPSFTDKAIELLARKGGKCRLLANPALTLKDTAVLDLAPRWRYVRGGFLKQPNYGFVLRNKHFTVGEPNPQQRKDLLLAWAIGSTSNSNTITLVRDGQLIGNGVGQQDRVGAAELAIKRAQDAGHVVKGAVAYSDSFFPFPDGPERLIDVGVTAILATSGSRRDQDVIDLCRKRGAVLVMVPDAETRGFFNH